MARRLFDFGGSNIWLSTAEGKITQIIGAVVDVAFPRDSIPNIYDALKLKDVDLTLEVQQQLGNGVVRTIAMGPSEGLKRGLGCSEGHRRSHFPSQSGESDPRPHHGCAGHAPGQPR